MQDIKCHMIRYKINIMRDNNSNYARSCIEVAMNCSLNNNQVTIYKYYYKQLIKEINTMRWLKKI